MTAMQATKLNAVLGNGLKDDSMLSPKQIQYYNSIKDKDKSKLKIRSEKDWKIYNRMLVRNSLIANAFQGLMIAVSRISRL